VEDSAVRVAFKIDTVLPVPASRDADGRSRSAEYTDLKITSCVSLAKGAKRVEIVTEVDNTARDHRLRVLFPSEIATDYSHAENAFDVVTRPVKVPECRDWRECMPSVHPQKTFVDISDGEAGLAIINEGLPEYQVIDDAQRTIALTLMRCVGNGVCGASEQVEGQMIGRRTFKYAIAPHAGNWLDAQIWQQGWTYNAPMKVARTGTHTGTLPLTKSFMSLDNPTVLLSTLKKAEQSNELILRLFNIGDEKAPVTITVDGLREASQTNMNEEQIGGLTTKDGKIELTVSGKQIITLAVDTGNPRLR
jgi:alpha-mannosidase/mannosylglycerate hydrolase